MKRDERIRLEPLRGFAPRPAPAGLGARVLAAASAVRPPERFFSPRQRALACGFTLIAFACLAADAYWTPLRARRWDALQARGGKPAETVAAPDEIREAVGPQIRLWTKLSIRESRRAPARRVIEWEGEVDDVGSQSPR